MAIIIVGAIGIIAGVGLTVAGSLMAVPVDERIGRVREALPGANCGACGFSGCDGYAKAIVEDGAACNLCAPGGQDVAAAVGDIMGSDAVAADSMTAVVRCNGNSENCRKKYEYAGLTTCAAVSMLDGGDKDCPYACLGYGDCQRACPLGAINVVGGVAVIDREKCTACKTCVAVCPRGIITMMPKDAKKAVTICSNKHPGALSRKECSVSCIGCKMCERACKFDAIHVENNLSHVDMDKCVGCGACVKVCPTKCLYISTKNK